MDSLDLKYSKSVLLEIYLHKEPVAKKDLAKVVKSHQVLDNLLLNLKKDGYVVISSNKIGPKTFKISLTDKGLAVAEKLKEADDIALGKTEIQINQMDNGKIDLALTNDEIEKMRLFNISYHINILDNHIIIKELILGKPTQTFNINIKKNGNGDFRLWCEQDNSYDCWHVRAAWTYPQVQQMMIRYKGKTKICSVCGYENPENAKFCMNCGAKL